MNDADIKRFWKKVDILDKEECWNWLAAKRASKKSEQKMDYGNFGSMAAQDYRTEFLMK